MHEIVDALNNSWLSGCQPRKLRLSKLQTGETVRFAETKIVTFLESHHAFRELTRGDSNSWDSTRVSVVSRRAPLFRKSVKEFARGEDPRLFWFGGEPWVMVQTFEEKRLDVVIDITNLKTGMCFSLNSPLGFNGKNWVPFEYAGSLYFAYSLEPLILLKCEFANSTIRLLQVNQIGGFDPHWGLDTENSIGCVRGGSPGITVGDAIFGFSHAINLNEDVHAHKLGFYSFDISGKDFKYLPLTRYVQGFLFDPYGVRLRGDLLELQGTIALKDIHVPESTIVSVSAAWEFSELVRQLGI